MELLDALMISLLGIGVVFSGLVLTNLLISSFSIFPRLLDRLRRIRKPVVEEVPTVTDIEKLEPDVLAVIATVLEVELRLKQLISENPYEKI